MEKFTLAWITSGDYQKVAKHPDAGSTASSILVKELE
jgi:hypothetical protein